MRVLLTCPLGTLLSYCFPDIGLGYLATGLRRAGFEPLLHLPDSKGWDTKRAVKAVRDNPVDLVGIKVMTTDLVVCRRLFDVSPQELQAIAGRVFIRLSLKPSRALFFLKNLNSLHKWQHLGASFGRHMRDILKFNEKVRS